MNEIGLNCFREQIISQFKSENNRRIHCFLENSSRELDSNYSQVELQNHRQLEIGLKTQYSSQQLMLFTSYQDFKCNSTEAQILYWDFFSQGIRKN